MITMLLYYELRHSFLSGKQFLETVGFLYYNIPYYSIYYIGYIAEDLDDIGEKHFVVYENDDTTPNSIQYDKIIIHAVECITPLHIPQVS